MKNVPCGGFKYSPKLLIYSEGSNVSILENFECLD